VVAPLKPHPRERSSSVLNHADEDTGGIIKKGRDRYFYKTYSTRENTLN
jgi:hypothetical protein